MNDAQQIQLTNGWRVLQAMSNTSAGHEPYSILVLDAFGAALAPHKRNDVFQWAMQAGAELEELLSR